MADIGNIKPPGPVWPQPAVEKINNKEKHSQQQQQQRHGPDSDKENDKDKNDEDNGIDEYV